MPPLGSRNDASARTTAPGPPSAGITERIPVRGKHAIHPWPRRGKRSTHRSAERNGGTLPTRLGVRRTTSWFSTPARDNTDDPEFASLQPRTPRLRRSRAVPDPPNPVALGSARPGSATLEGCTASSASASTADTARTPISSNPFPRHDTGQHSCVLACSRAFVRARFRTPSRLRASEGQPHGPSSPIAGVAVAHQGARDSLRWNETISSGSPEESLDGRQPRGVGGVGGGW